MALTPGTRLGVYEVVAPIGAGGMGQVFRARDTKLGRDVAIKILPEAFAHDADRLARFTREAKTLASLNHPNIAGIYGLEERDGVTALVMELVEGEDLSQRIARGAIPIDEALPIAKQIAEALEAAHEQGIIHRDLKPANIKVRADGTVKVLDFGLAKVIEPASRSSPSVSMSPTITTPAMTQAGMILGTAAYMSPEQAKGRLVDERGDVWAFGCVLYEMLTGARAFPGDDVSETLAAIIKSDPDWSKLPANTPAAIRRLLRRCLAKDRVKRIGDISAAQLEIDDALDEPDASDQQGRPSPRANSNLFWKLAAAGASVIAAIAVARPVFLRPPAVERLVTRLDVVTALTQDSFSFALSPDGRQLVYEANGPTSSQLWLRPLDQAVGRPIPGTEGGSIPFWAPTNRTIGFFAEGKLKRVDLAGGAPIVLADAPVGRGGTWNDDGVIVFAPSSNSGLMRVPAKGGPPAQVAQLAPGQGSLRWPQFLPDGRHVLFTVGLGQPETRGTFVVSLDGGNPTRLRNETAAGYANGYLLTVSRGTLFAQAFDPVRLSTSGEPLHVADAVGEDASLDRSAVSVSAAGVLAYRSGSATKRQLMWVDRSGKGGRPVTEPDDSNIASPELSLDDGHIAVNRTIGGNADIWAIDLARATLTRLTFNVGLDLSPIWSPDGMQVVFRSARNGHYDLFVKASDNLTDEKLLLVSSVDKSPLDWSKDGKLLYVSQDQTSGSDLWVLPLTGDRKPFAVVQSPSDDIEGQFSPDGQWIAYASNESRSGYQIYLCPLTGAGVRQLSTAGGTQPRWSRDGSAIFYLAADNRVMAVPMATATMTPGPPKVLFEARLASGSNITSVGFSARAQYAVARDGRFLINVSADDGTLAPITVFLNWQEELKRLVPTK